MFVKTQLIFKISESENTVFNEHVLPNITPPLAVIKLSKPKLCHITHPNSGKMLKSVLELLSKFGKN